MFKNRPILFLAVAALAIVLSGCGEYEKLLKSRDFKKKYEMGLAYYEDEEYVRAATLFDQVANIYRGPSKPIRSSITRPKVITPRGII